nr:hybrid signal transduction histidine kinase M [Tanacetum cinerariifolium]
MSINEYCTKIKSMADRLKNLGSSVSENNLVIYAVNRIDSRFATIVKIIRHRESLPTFEMARKMLLLKESTLNEQTDRSTTFDSSSSSPTILMATTLSEPKDPKWHHAMYDENNALVKNGSWILLLRRFSINMVRSMWLFKQKFHVDRTLSRYKAHLVTNGSNQQLGIDCDETFSLVVKPDTIYTVLSLVVSYKWHFH